MNLFVLITLSLFLTESLHAEDVKVLYQKNCASCHGETGAGDGPLAASIKPPKPSNFKAGKFKYGKTEADLLKVITKGVPFSQMVAWKDLLSDSERAELARYVLSLSEKK